MVTSCEVHGPVGSIRIEHLLVGLSSRIRPEVFPGCDGMTRDEVLGVYLDLARQGQVPGLEELICRYPKCEHDLREFFKVS
ncbi:hypothetical protein FYK55_16550 [Roseiconus nitratireducens]|uniref:Uncharacterized protein n=1 Tax=Roseiconus nitratireducens TaxID=2605748 RepID=A0A5M6D2U9_9BACT|nr:hypothetical protein [Roseiconus nitratireducens]KAA5541818.1 hypothetical protein FYK55_16550 [Roseiconus nitratireducens]